MLLSNLGDESMVVTRKLPLHSHAAEPVAQQSTHTWDCIVIGYNDVPVATYESWLGAYGREREAYRDLRLSLVDLGAQKVDYVSLLNLVSRKAERKAGRLAPWGHLRGFDIPNLAAVHLTQHLRRRGLKCTYVNLFQADRDKLEELLAFDTACVAITTTFYVTNEPVREIVDFVRRTNSSVRTIVGGPLVANHERNGSHEELRVALADIGADVYVVDSQGESTLANVVARLSSGRPITDVPNVAWLEDGQLFCNARIPESNDMDANFIDWTQFVGAGLGNTLQLRTARSCAFACSFCNYPTRAGKLSLTSIAVLERELDSILALGSVRNAVFIDDTFNVPLRRFKDICRLMIRRRYGLRWFSYFRCSHVDDEALDLMAESGCRGVFLGIESGSSAILAAMNKRSRVEDYVRCIEQLRARSILTFASFIVGFPGETETTVQETIRFIQAARPHYYRAQLWYNEPGTPIQEQAAAYHIAGSGFVWKHRTMASDEAMNHVERMFLSIRESIWLPQHSFDFWIIPYLSGKGMSLELFSNLMKSAQALTALSVAHVDGRRLAGLRSERLHAMVSDITSALRSNAASSDPGWA